MAKPAFYEFRDPAADDEEHAQDLEEMVDSNYSIPRKLAIDFKTICVQKRTPMRGVIRKLISDFVEQEKGALDGR